MENIYAIDENLSKFITCVAMAESKFSCPPAVDSLWQQGKVNQQLGESCKSQTCETRSPCGRHGWIPRPFTVGGMS